MPEKTFDRAELLRFFDENGQGAIVGKLTVIHPPKDLYSDTTTERYPIAAETQALHCEKYGFAVVIQRVHCDGLRYLPKIHPLRSEQPLHFRYGGDATSAQLVRWAAELADQWRAWVEYAAPSFPIDLTGRDRTDPEAGPEFTLVPLAEDVPTPEPAPEPESEQDDDHTPTGLTIDDPFAGEDGDE